MAKGMPMVAGKAFCAVAGKMLYGVFRLQGEDSSNFRIAHNPTATHAHIQSGTIDSHGPRTANGKGGLKR